LALGVVVAGAFEMLDDRVYSEKELKDMLPARVLCEVPIVVTPSDERSSKMRATLGWVVATLVFGCILAGSAISYLRG